MTEVRLNAYHIMWLFCLFDLPVVSKKERKEAFDFRKLLLKDGFVMFQYSVYIRHCSSSENVEVHKRRVKSVLPRNGKVSLLTITDKQFGDMETVTGLLAKKQLKIPIQVELF